MKKLLIAVAPLALATACSGGSSDELQPGEWTMTSEITEVEIPGMPEEMAAQMREQLAGEQDAQTQCITEEQAANPGGNLFSPEGAAEDCEFGDSTVEGGVININGTCEAPGGQGTATMSIEGTYTPTTMESRSFGQRRGRPDGNDDVGHDERRTHGRLRSLKPSHRSQSTSRRGSQGSRRLFLLAALGH